MPDFTNLTDGSVTYVVKDKEARASINTLNTGLESVKQTVNGHTQQLENLADLPAGSTTLDAELVDIRKPISAVNGGNAYGSAGAAVRAQVQYLEDEMSDIHKTSLYLDDDGYICLTES